MSENEGLSWPVLLNRIRTGDPTGGEELERLLRAFRPFLCRQLGPADAQDALQDALLAIYQAIQRGAIHSAECLMGFSRTVVHRQVAGRIHGMVRARRHCDCEDVVLRDSSPNPEQAAIRGEAIELAHRMLAGLAPQEREILVHAYIDEKSNTEIKREMGLTEVKYRNLKHHAKNHLAERVSRAKARKYCVPAYSL